MYLAHYGLREPPFSITPDPRFVHLSERHRDALAHLLYGIGQGGGSGFVQLTGEVGTGKTTLSRLLLEQLPANARVALILNPLLSPTELLEAICEELRLDIDGRRGNLKALVDALNAYLLEAHAAGLRVVLIIDEAQILSPESLEQVRLLTNLETATQKLLQIILLGQPELREQLARPELRQLAQRITARYHLDPLDADESEAYLRHRWAVAGGNAFPFTQAGARRLHRHAGGIPRLLNVIAERALLAGYARGERVVGERLLDQAAREVLAPRLRSRGRLGPTAFLVLVAAVVIVAAAFEAGRWLPEPHAPKPAATVPLPTLHPTGVAGHVPRRTPPPIEPAAPVKVATATTPIVDDARFTNAIATGKDDARRAWKTLAGLWSIRADEIDPATAGSCPRLSTPGLFCTSGKQNLSLLAQFDRPMLLRLGAGGHSVWAVLLGLGATEAQVQLEGDTMNIHRSVLEDALLGYAIVGRSPPGITLPIRRGDTGMGVEWLRHRLHADPGAATTARPGFDSNLMDAVRTAQRGFGLHPDGVVGPETLLALLAADGDGPHLRRLPE